MNKKVLITYASRCGSTVEVAGFIGETLRRGGIEADVSSVKKVKDLNPYGVVIIGTAVRMGRPLHASVRFVKKFSDALKEIPVALFSVGIQMKEDTEENRKEARRFLNPLISRIGEPVHVGLFGEKIDYSKLALWWRFTFSKDDTGSLEEGDWRNWEAIRTWTQEVSKKLPVAK